GKLHPAYSLPIGDRRVDDRAGRENTGVVDEDVDPAVLGGDPLGAALKQCGIADVELDRAPRTLTGRGTRRGFDIGIAEIGDAAFVGERDRDRGADAAARAGDERDLAVESQVHGESTILPGTARVVARGDPGLEPRSPRRRRTQSASPGPASIPGFPFA